MLTGCMGGSLRPDVVKTDEVKQACPFTTGTVIRVADVTIEGNVEAAQASGAAVGGYLGNRATNDKGDIEEALGTIAGVAIGNVVGDTVGKGMAKPGVALYIELKSGKEIKVSQESSDYKFFKGQSVIIDGHIKRTYYNKGCPLNVIPKE